MSPVINPLYTLSENFDFGYINDKVDEEDTKLGNRLLMLENAKFNPINFSSQNDINEFFENEVQELEEA